MLKYNRLMTTDQTKRQQIFPFWNKPELRIIFDISVKHPWRYIVLSNMPIREFESAFNDTTWTHFYTTPLISIDNVALVVFINFHSFNSIYNYHGISNLSEAVMIWSRTQLLPQMEFAQYIAENINTYLRNNSMSIFERTYVSFEKKVDHVAILNLRDEIKQTLGFVFYK